MSFFNDDPFDDMLNQLFGEGAVRRKNSENTPEEEERTIDYIETTEHVYVILEFPGYDYDDVKVKTTGKNLYVVAAKKNLQEVKEYLAQKFAQGVEYKKQISENANPKKFEYTVRNGVIEIRFRRKK